MVIYYYRYKVSHILLDSRGIYRGNDGKILLQIQGITVGELHPHNVHLWPKCNLCLNTVFFDCTQQLMEGCTDKLFSKLELSLLIFTLMSNTCFTIQRKMFV